MKADFINPLIQATADTFTMMLGVEPRRTNVIIRRGTIETYGLSGIIKIEGKVDGAIVLNMPEDVALSVASGFTGEELKRVTSDVVDAIGELTNIVAGDAKTRLFQEGYEFDISLPRVVLGRNLLTIGSDRAPWVVISFQSNVGSFDLEASMVEQIPHTSEAKEE